jgi:hypothetical protein
VENQDPASACSSVSMHQQAPRLREEIEEEAHASWLKPARGLWRWPTETEGHISLL